MLGNAATRNLLQGQAGAWRVALRSDTTHANRRTGRTCVQGWWLAKSKQNIHDAIYGIITHSLGPLKMAIASAGCASLLQFDLDL